MGRYLEAQCRLCRREGMKLFLKGVRCNTEKCSFTKRPRPPGPAPKGRQRKQSYYSMQLREKQKVKRIYGMREEQFRRFFRLAAKFKGVTGRKLIELLERRIDNVIYRVLYVLSRNEGRQVVRHGFVFVNNKRVDIPSYIVEKNDVVSIKGSDSVLKRIRGNKEINAKERSVPKWIDAEDEALQFVVAGLPEKEDLSLQINEQYIVELYSK